MSMYSWSSSTSCWCLISCIPVWASPALQTLDRPASTLEAANCPGRGPVEGGCCGGCPHPPHGAPVPQVTMPTIGCVEVCHERGDGCLHDSGMELVGTLDMTMEDIPLDTKSDNRLPIQIFPDPVEVVLGPEGTLACVDHSGKERLPSIVVDPTDVSEVESGELRWPPEDMDLDDDEEDLFLEQCIPPANIADWGVDEDEEVDQEVAAVNVLVNHHHHHQQQQLQHTSLLDLQPDDFRDETPTLPPESAPSRN
ncbi:uncharacterized protein lbhl [Engraulis encrasicolus]|uniref:uncharacterized protein lbhl n=1 Tax=Engraulis encrasicolus TaxID=184585 RepID=UPI002FCED738